MAASAADLGFDAARLAVGGQSAGGGLAAALALLARDRGGPHIAFQLLLYPALDDRQRTLSAREMSNAPVFDSRKNALMWEHYLARVKPGDGVDYYASPARAEDLSRLPPAYVLTCQHDPLRDEGIVYAKRMMEAGVDVELRNAAATFHAFDSLASTTPIARQALDEQRRKLHEALTL
jgi:acetyl esterase/lipase